MDLKYPSTIPTMTSGKIYDPNDPSTYPSNPVSYSPYSGSPPPGIPTTYTGGTLVGMPVPAPHTQYTGAPEL